MHRSLFILSVSIMCLFFLGNCDSTGDGTSNGGGGRDISDGNNDDDNEDGESGADGEDGESGGGGGDDESGGDSDSDSDSDDDEDNDGNDGQGLSDTETEWDTVCDESNFEIAGRTVDMLIVLDRSLSMSEDGFWNPMGRALAQATAATESQVNFGLLTFPFTDADCNPGDILIEIGPGNAQAIDESVGGGIRDVGTALGTPTAESLVIAKQYLDTIDDGLDKYVLLANDGAPNCNPSLDANTCTCSVSMEGFGGGGCLEGNWCLDDQATYLAAAQLKEAGYQTFVLGIGDSMQWGDVMDTVAKAGGTGSYISADSDQFVDVLMAIIGGIISCEFDVDWDSLGEDTTRDPTMVNFYCKQSSEEEASDENIIYYDENCQGNGWRWTDPENPSTVQMCDERCDMMRSGACPVISATFGCHTEPIPI